MVKTILPALLLIICSCSQKKGIGTLERYDSALDSLIIPGSSVEIMADGFTWTEGPVWIEEKKMLLFSDVFSNKVYKWTEEIGVVDYLVPSGYTGTIRRGGELGSNGLLLNKDGKLVICQHGNRQVAFMNADLDNPKAVFTPLADNFNGKKLNSPNDACFSSSGDLYFTDPPYGLEARMSDPLKELAFQGVYKRKASGEIVLLTDSITRPNGIALFPGDSSILVANSDSSKPYWYVYDLHKDSIINGRIFYDATTALQEAKGLPDGLKIDRNGNVFATGPGGVFIINRQGKLLGKIKLPVPAANCAFSGDQKTLFITASNFVLKIKMR